MDMEAPTVSPPRSGPAADDVQQAVELSGTAHVVKQVPAKRAKGKRKRSDVGPEVEVDMLSQTSFHLQPSLYVKGHQFSFAKTADNQAVARKRAEDSDALRLEEKRRLVDGLFAKENSRIRRAGGVPWNVPGDRSSSNTSLTGESAHQPPSQPTEEGEGRPMVEPTSAMETRVPEQEEAEFAQTLETALEDFPARDPETGQVPALSVANDETIIIHPGSRYLKIGRGSDLTPISVPNCIYRKIHRPKTNGNGSTADGADTQAHGRNENIPNLSSLGAAADTERSTVVASLRNALRERMRQEKLRLPAGKADQPIMQVTRYNASQKPTIYKPHNDPYGVDWLEDYSADTVFPDKNLWIDEDAPYEQRYPIRSRTFNTVDYGENPTERILSDVQDILENALTKLNPPVQAKDLWKYSVALIVPDHTDKAYIEGMCTVLLQRMAFRQCGILQESSCATFGAGLSSACVVDIGAERSSIACVDDGLLLAETRHILHFGRDDVTTFYTDLLRRVSFPYHEVDLNRRLDWQMMDELTTRTCTLLDHLVAFNVWKVQVRRKGSPTTEYQLQTFDQTVLAPACFFDPRVFDWNAKMAKVVTKTIRTSYDDDSIPDLRDDGVTVAMGKSTEHLLPPLPPLIYQDPVTTVSVDPETGEEVTSTFQPEPIQPPAPPATFDVVTEAGKMPIDFAVTNSLLAAGADMKTVNLASAILILGGGGLIEGISPALAWRVGQHFNGRMTTAVTPEVLPPPRGLDPRFVTWRGGVVWTRLDQMNDLWIKRQEWDEIGIKAYRNRST